MIRFLKGYCRIRIMGADPIRAINRMNARKLSFWDIERTDELTVCCCMAKKDCAEAKKAVLSAMCTLTVLQEHSISRCLGGLRRRKVLLCGVAVACLLALFSQNFVWTVQIEGNETIPTEQIRQQLEEVGVCFGAWAPSINSESVQIRMLNRIGKLAWLAVNRCGGVLTVSVSEREDEATDLDRRVFANLVADRSGVLTKVDVYNGFAEVEPGDAVVTGQILVSGMADWETHTQITRAMGEVFAQTLRQQTFCLPKEATVKRYTGKTYRQVSLVFGRKRIKLSGNSGISYPSCDKMTYRSVCALPGGYRFPLTVETVVFREYTLETVPLPENAARQQLTEYSDRYVRGQMIAGTVLGRDDTLTEEDGAYRLVTAFSCEEMIARVRYNEEVLHGTNDQCGAD